MPKKLELKPSLGKLGKYLVRNEITIAHLMRKSGLSHRTVWLAVHGYTVSYSSAVKIVATLKRISVKNKRSNSGNHDVTIKSLCSGKPRAEFVSTVE